MHMRRTLLLLVLLALLPGAVLGAQPPARPAGAQEEFVPVSQLPQVEQLPAAPMVIGAYAVVWVALMVYVWTLWKRMTKIERELTDLRRRLQH
jgi:CcmD family protein